MPDTIYSSAPATTPAQSPLVYYNDPDAGKNQTMYDPTGTLQRVKDTMVVNRFRQGWSDKLPTVTVTGTAIAGGVAEAAIVNGGETLIFTLSNGGTWGTNLEDQAANLLNGLDTGSASWISEVAEVIADTDLAISGNGTILTLTLPAAGSYSIAGDDTVTFELSQYMVVMNGVPLTGETVMVASPTTFVITNA